MISWKVKNTRRLLSAIKEQFSNYSLKQIRWSIDHNRCFVNHKVERFGSRRVEEGDTISICLETPPSLLCQEPTRIVFEDSHLLVYDKPPFICCEKLADLKKCLLVHRLDRDTSGVMLFAKTKVAQNNLEGQFRQRTVIKEYEAVVEGNPRKEGVIKGYMTLLRRQGGGSIWGISSRQKIKGLYSETRWVRLAEQGPWSRLRCIPLTGRTHQIRVHLSHIGHPIVGDPVYGHRTHQNIFRPLLHALKIGFIHPILGTPLFLSTPLPADFLSHFKF
jgi:23S rRNA pseudouridine955/2504/2580 synthase